MFRRTLQDQVNTIISKSGLFKRRKHNNNLLNAIIAAIFLVLLPILLVLLHTTTGFIMLEVQDADAWRSYVNTAWQVHSGVLGISMTVLVFLVQAVTSARVFHFNFLKRFAEKNHMFPILLIGLLGIVDWGYISAASTNPNISSYFSAGLLEVACITSFLTIGGIVFLYSRMFSAFNSDLFDQLIKENIEVSLEEDVRRELSNRIFDEFLKENRIKRDKEYSLPPHPIIILKAGEISNVNLKKLKKIATNYADELVLNILPHQRVGIGDIIGYISFADQKITSKIIESFITTPAKMFLDFDLSILLGSLITELNIAIKEINKSKISYIMHILLSSSVDLHLKKEKICHNQYLKLSTFSTGILAKNSICNHISQAINSVINDDKIETFVAVEEMLYIYLKMALEQKSIFLYNAGLGFYRMCYEVIEDGKHNSNLRSNVINAVLEEPLEQLKLTKWDKRQLSNFSDELLLHYLKILYLSSDKSDYDVTNNVFNYLDLLEEFLYSYNITCIDIKRENLLMYVIQQSHLLKKGSISKEEYYKYVWRLFEDVRYFNNLMDAFLMILCKEVTWRAVTNIAIKKVDFKQYLIQGICSIMLLWPYHSQTDNKLAGEIMSEFLKKVTSMSDESLFIQEVLELAYEKKGLNVRIDFRMMIEDIYDLMVPGRKELRQIAKETDFWDSVFIQANWIDHNIF